MKSRKLISGLLAAVMIVASIPTGGIVSKAAETDYVSLNDGLVLYSSFDEGTVEGNNVTDISGNGHNGTVQGSVTYVDGISGKAINMPSTDRGYVDYGKSNDIIPETGDFSISLWYMATGDTNNGTLISNKNYDSGKNRGIAIGTFDDASGNDLRINFVASSSLVEMNGSRYSQLTMAQNRQWHHLAVSYERSGDMTCYVDGISIGSLPISNQQESIDVGLNMSLGADGNGKWNLYNAIVDELRIYNKAISTDVVNALYEDYEQEADVMNFKIRLPQIKANLEMMVPDSSYPEDVIKEMLVKVGTLEKVLYDPDLEVAEAKDLIDVFQQEYDAFLKRGAPNASFHLVSDVHINTSGVPNSYVTAMKNMKDINPDTTIAFVNAGDFTDYSGENEYQTFYDLTQANNPVSDEQTLIIQGNHDVRGPNQSQWVTDPGKPQPYWETAKTRYLQYNAPYFPEDQKDTLYHTKTLGTTGIDENGYTFIMLNTEMGLKDSMYMSPEQIIWLDKTMGEAYENDPGKPIFIIAHEALVDTHWLCNTLDGFDGIKPDGTPQPYQSGGDAAVKRIMAKYPNGIFISGHLHNEFGRAEAIVRPYGVVVDVPTFGQGGINIDFNVKGAGYEVEIHDEKVVFRAVNFIKNEWYPEYDVVIPMPGYSAIYQQANNILTTDEQYCYDKNEIKKLKVSFDKLDSLVIRYYDQSKLNWDSIEMPPKQLYQEADHMLINDATAELQEILDGMEKIPDLVTYKVTIDPSMEHGSVEADKPEAAAGEFVTLTVVPEEGYLLKEGSLKVIEGTVEVTNNNFLMPKQDVTVTAEFEQKAVITTYKLVFDANGGKVSPASITVTKGLAYGKLPVPSREGYSFKGWFTTASGGTQIREGEVCRLNADTSIYAQWSKMNLKKPGKPTGLKTSRHKSGSIQISWQKASNAKGYVLYRYNSSAREWRIVKTTTATSYVDAGLKSAADYKYRVKAYSQLGKEKKYGSYSSVMKTATAPKRPDLLKAKKDGKGKVTINWSRKSGTDGYVIYMRTNKGEYKKIATKSSKASSYTKSGLKKGRTYRFKVRGFHKTGDKRIYSSYSDSKKIDLS